MEKYLKNYFIRKGILLLSFGLIFGVGFLLFAGTAWADFDQRADIILDDEFARDYYNDKYKELLAMRNRIAEYASNINSFSQSIKEESAGLDEQGEEALILRALEAADVCGRNIMNLTEAVALFTKAIDQYIIFEDLEKQFETVITDLDYYISELNDIISSSKNEEYKLIYWRVKDKIREARGLFKELKTDIENRYKMVKRQKEGKGE